MSISSAPARRILDVHVFLEEIRDLTSTKNIYEQFYEWLLTSHALEDEVKGSSRRSMHRRCLVTKALDDQLWKLEVRRVQKVKKLPKKEAEKHASVRNLDAGPLPISKVDAFVLVRDD